MTVDVRRILDDALRLPENDRAELAGLLIDSLDEGQDAGVQAAWSDEIARRLDELDSGAVTPIPWAEVRRRLTNKSSE
jgi:putative addiction module component (TIGR02574 family)